MSQVVIIGGGFAGLSAAARLAAAGRRVLVLEARNRLGGRATAFKDVTTGELVDNGQHVLFGAYHETFAFLDRIGATNFVSLQAALEVPYVHLDGRRTTLRCPPLPSPLHLLAGVLEWEALGIRDRASVLRIARVLRTARRYFERGEGPLPCSPTETVENWLEVNGQTRAICALLWEPLALAALNQPPREAAALPFVRVLDGLFNGDRRNSALGLPTRPLHLAYAEPARAYIEARGGEVRTGATAQVVLDASGVTGVRTGEHLTKADAVIAAVPWHALAGLFEPGPGVEPLKSILQAAERTAASPIVTVNLWFDRPILDTPFVGLPGRAIHWVFDKRLLLGGETSHLSMVVSGASDLITWSNDDITSLAERELLEALPDARLATVTRATVIREPRATFSLAPGQPARPGTSTPVAGLYLAGDWIATGLPGTIESAVVSGHRAAAAVLASP